MMSTVVSSRRPELKLSPDELREASGLLLVISGKHAADERSYAFPFIDAFPTPIGVLPAHRCLCVADAKAKVSRARRIFRWSLDQMLERWDQLSFVQLLALQIIILSAGKQERERSPDGLNRAWYRLDDLLYGLVHSAWIKGSLFAATPPPSFLAQRLGVDLLGFKTQLEQFRANLANPSSVEPRVNLWLGDPPPRDPYACAPRLWVSHKRDTSLESEATIAGLYPANTAEQVQNAREMLSRRWAERDEDCIEQVDEVQLSRHQTTVCRWCGETGRFRVFAP